MDDYKKWLKINKVNINNKFIIDWFHIGSDITSDNFTKGIPHDAEKLFQKLKSRPSILSVSTVEPRKAYGQMLSAFEILWNSGIDVNFIIVGRPGWKVDQLIARLERHPELGRRLFWLQGISDEYLDSIYSKTDGVLFASLVEGFGLAVIEGAQHGKPLILRDIPVFREIAGEHATYFTGVEPQSLAECLKTWIANLKKGNVVSSKGIHPLTWAESTNMLISKLHLSQSYDV